MSDLIKLANPDHIKPDIPISTLGPLVDPKIKSTNKIPKPTPNPTPRIHEKTCTRSSEYG